MLKSKIVRSEPGGSLRAELPATFLAGVERANRFLQTDSLATLQDQIDIDVTWTFVHQPSGRNQVLLDLTTTYEGRPVGITGYPFDADAFSDESHIRSSLHRPVWNFTSLLSYLNKFELKHDRERLQDSLFAGVA